MHERKRSYNTEGVPDRFNCFNNCVMDSVFRCMLSESVYILGFIFEFQKFFVPALDSCRLR